MEASVAEDPAEGVVAVGSYQPMGELAEIMAVATLPSARRRGLAGALTALLARHAHDEAGVRTVLLSAQDEAVARVDARVGFAQVGMAHAADRDRALPPAPLGPNASSRPSLRHVQAEAGRGLEHQ